MFTAEEGSNQISESSIRYQVSGIIVTGLNLVFGYAVQLISNFFWSLVIRGTVRMHNRSMF